MTTSFDFISEILLDGACNNTAQCKDQNANCVGGASNKLCTCLNQFYSYEAKCMESMCSIRFDIFDTKISLKLTLSYNNHVNSFDYQKCI